MGKKIVVSCLEVIMIAFFPRNIQVSSVFAEKARVNTERVLPGHPIILLKSNKFNMAAVSVKRSIDLNFFDKHKAILLFQEKRRQHVADITFAKPPQGKKIYHLKITYIYYAYVKTLKRSLFRKEFTAASRFCETHSTTVENTHTFPC